MLVILNIHVLHAIFTDYYFYDIKYHHIKRISYYDYIPTNTPRVFHVEMMWRRFNVEYTWYVCRVAERN